MFPTILNIIGSLLNWLGELLTDAIESVGAMHEEADDMTEEEEEVVVVVIVEIGNGDFQYSIC